jgi:hypothetical protein
LGYQTRDRKIAVVEHEARTVRHIFRRYLELSSLNLLLADLRTTGIKTKVRPLANGRTIGGIPFSRGSLAAFLRNRFYIGEVRYKGEVFPGEQPAILDRAMFEAVQAKLDQQRTNYAKARQQSQSLLMGRIFDHRGNRMTPTFAVKNGIRYRYYISAPLLQGQSDKAAKLNRVPAAEIEGLIIGALSKQIGISHHNEKIGDDAASPTDRELISTHVARVDVKQDHLAIQLLTVSAPQSETPTKRWPKEQEISEGRSRLGDEQTHPNATTLLIPWKKKSANQPRQIIAPSPTAPPADPRPIRAETRAKLITAIASGRRWLDELIVGTVPNVERIAQRETCSIRQVNRTITLAFLAPTLVQAAVDGRLPRGIGVASLRDFPVEWKRQHAILGLSS